MAIDALKTVARMNTTATPSATTKPAQNSASETAVDPASVSAAVEQLQSHLDSATGTSEFRIDYLSGLNVVTVRSTNTGEVIRQMPSSHAVEVARLIREGNGTALNILDTFA